MVKLTRFLCAIALGVFLSLICQTPTTRQYIAEYSTATIVTTRSQAIMDPAAQAANNPQINGLIQAFINAANAAAAAHPPPGPVVAPAAAAFALLPGKASNAPLDFNKASDTKIFNRAIYRLDTKFDIKGGNMTVFLESVKERSMIYDWEDIMNVPDDDGVVRNLLTNFGQVTAANVKMHSLTYMKAHTRNAQNSIMMYHFLSNSITEASKLNILANPSLYTEDKIPSGPMLLKLIIGKASIDTPATMLILRESIANLHIKMSEMKGNVREFNVYVEQQRKLIAGRGYNVDELLMHLFRAYEGIPDPTFSRYIETKRNEFEDGRLNSAEDLMEQACKKYDILIERGLMSQVQGKDDKDIIIALQSQVKQLEDKYSKLGNKGPKQETRSVPEWKKTPPKAGEPQVKMIGKKKYYWCPFHKMWTIHAPSTCRLDPNHANHEPKAAANQKEPANDDQLVISRALQAIVSSSDSNENGNENA